MKKIFTTLLFTGMAVFAFSQGITTASLSGLILDNNGEVQIGANVVATHTPTGAVYGTITRVDGNYIIPNMRVGGPYTIVVTYVGFQDVTIEDVYLRLGQTKKLDFTLYDSTVNLSDVVVTASRTGGSTERTGAETNVGEYQIKTLPTISRDITDFTRTTPQATLTEDNDGELGFSVAGQNNRFNSLFIDGAISNDVFGLADQGTNGGQAGVSPISMDAIEEFQIVVAPFDVTYGGFTGGGVNAVTRSGTNTIKGSAYWLNRNQNLAGKTPTDNPDFERMKLADFSSNIYGLRLGGPIIKNKLFFFVNAEVEKRSNPLPAPFEILGDSIAGYDGDATVSQLTAFENKLKEFGYDPGGYLNNEKKVDAFKLLAKIDWNINKNNKLSFRHSYSEGNAEKVNPSTRFNINYNNSYELFPSKTNSSALELNSIINEEMSNRLVIGATFVRDNRGPLGGDFPRLSITDGNASIVAGTEPFSTANNLEQDVITLTNNFKIFKGKHTITIGTHNEFYKILNLFIRQNYGQYEYNTLDDFLNDAQPNLYARSYSLVDGRAVGDAITEAAANFNALQLGFYGQDEFRVNQKVRLTAGLRIDIPMFLDDPPVDEQFNSTTIPLIEEFYDLKGAKAGQMPSTQLLFSPRLGFNIDVKGDQSTILRGGVGIFTSRLPLVWAGGSHTNNGLTVGGVFEFSPELENGDPLRFNPDINTQPTAEDFGKEDPVPSGQMDLFVEDLKFPQVLKANVAIDQQLPWGMLGTFEAIYTKQINSIVYFNYNLRPDVGNLVGPDKRPIYDRRDEIDDTYTRIILGDNTSEGYSTTFTASIMKPFKNGFTGSVSYTYGYAEGLNDLTSSQNSSQWRNVEVGPYGKNNLSVTRSDFSVGSRVVVAGSYRLEYTDHLATTFSIFYNGQSGEVLSYTYTGRNADKLTSQDSRDFTDLIYVPMNESEINLVDYTASDGSTVSAAQQWNDLNEFITQDEYLSERRGNYAERNGARGPFSNIVDLKISQDFFIEAGGRKHEFQVTFDIFNFTNMINKDWGRRYRSFINGVGLITVEGLDDVEVNGRIERTPSFSYRAPSTNTSTGILSIDDIGSLSSRWQAQLGLRYTF